MSQRSAPPPFAFAALAVGAILVSPLTAQTPDENIALTGIVVDAATGAGIPGATVIWIDRADPAWTDREGRFSFSDVSVGTRTVIVTQLGYDSLRTDVEIVAGGEPLTLRLNPDPIAMERITTTVKRIDNRRYGGSARILDQVQLQRSAGLSAFDIARTWSGLMPVTCPEVATMYACAFVRGRVVRVSVAVDDAPIMGGFEVLRMLRPEDLYALVVMQNGRAIRAYTNWYMESVASGRRAVMVF